MQTGRLGQLVLLATATALTAALGAPAATAGQKRPSRDEADRFSMKLQEISDHSVRAERAPRLTPITEQEVNAYLLYYGLEKIPAGIVEPAVSMLGGGRVAARAVVDLDAVRKSRQSSSWLDPSSLLTGRVPVTAEGKLYTRAGVGRLEVETATISGVPVPQLVLQELVSYYSRSVQRPQGVSLDDPFDLPARIQEIRVDERRAVVVQ